MKTTPIERNTIHIAKLNMDLHILQNELIKIESHRFHPGFLYSSYTRYLRINQTLLYTTAKGHQRCPILLAPMYIYPVDPRRRDADEKPPTMNVNIIIFHSRLRSPTRVGMAGLPMG